LSGQLDRIGPTTNEQLAAEKTITPGRRYSQLMASDHNGTADKLNPKTDSRTTRQLSCFEIGERARSFRWLIYLNRFEHSSDAIANYLARFQQLTLQFIAFLVVITEVP